MRILVTGAAGFVGPFAARSLRRLYPTAQVVGTSRNEAIAPDFDEMLALDIRDALAVREAIEKVQPTHVLHLAGIAAPGLAASNPELAWQVNVFGTINIARALLTLAPDCILANAGSGLVYGDSALPGTPLEETALPIPLDDYGVTKMAADLAIGSLTREGLQAIRMRPFNHTGPGQGEDYVVPAFAMQIARIEAGLTDPVIRVGNLDAERDFLDVRDVADAYALALGGSHSVPSGTILNLASGQACRIGDILRMLLSFSDAAIQIEQDASRMRPSDIPRIVGDATRAKKILNWSPRFSIDRTLEDTLKECRVRVKRNAI